MDVARLRAIGCGIQTGETIRVGRDGKELPCLSSISCPHGTHTCVTRGTICRSHEQEPAVRRISKGCLRDGCGWWQRRCYGPPMIPTIVRPPQLLVGEQPPVMIGKQLGKAHDG